MRVSLLIFCIGLTMTKGEECTSVEDPIKRDEGQGPFNISRVQRLDNGRNGKLVAVDLQTHPFKTSLYEGDSYVIQYAVRAGRKPDVIYFWQGASSSIWEKGASAILTVQLDDGFGGVAKQARVVQGSEPSHFLKMFGGSLVTLLGGIERESVEKDTDGTMLFKVKSTCNEKGAKKPLTRTNQIQEEKGEINNDDVFILKTPSSLYIFEAKNASSDEKATAKKVASTLFPGVKARIESGNKPSTQFLNALN